MLIPLPCGARTPLTSRKTTTIATSATTITAMIPDELLCSMRNLHGELPEALHAGHVPPPPQAFAGYSPGAEAPIRAARARRGDHLLHGLELVSNRTAHVDTPAGDRARCLRRDGERQGRVDARRNEARDLWRGGPTVRHHARPRLR